MKQTTALIVRHVPYEGVAEFRDPIEAAGYRVDRVDVSDPGFSQIDLCHHDLLIMMGGPIAVAAGQAMIADWLEAIDQANRAEPPTLPLFQKARPCFRFPS